MAEAKTGDSVKVHYKGTLGDGTVFDSSEGRDPLDFTIGAGSVIPGFENAVTGMSVGEEKTSTIPAAEAYGDRIDELVFEVERSQIPPDMDPKVGEQLQIKLDDDRTVPVEITSATEDKVTLDANHPLAGKDLTFSFNLVEISK